MRLYGYTVPPKVGSTLENANCELKSSAVMAEATAALYHERQHLYRCGIHALNNALQGTVSSYRLRSLSLCILPRLL